MMPGFVGSDFLRPKSRWVPFQFLMGASPISMEAWLRLLVPHFRSRIFSIMPSTAICVGNIRVKTPR